MPVSFPSAWVQPSPFLLKIDRKSDIGRTDFEDRYQFLLAGRPVHLNRLGLYVKRAGANDVFILDHQMYSLVEAMDSFNALTPEQKTQQQSWLTFAKVKGFAKETGAALDATLLKNDVIVPSTIGLDMREDADGALSFLPKCPELASQEFQQGFERNPGAEKLYSLDRPGLGRVRIVLSDEQHEVLRRMKRVRRVTGATKERLAQDPAQAFDGVIDHIELPYGERVVGIGEFRFTPVPRLNYQDANMAGIWKQGTETKTSDSDSDTTTTVEPGMESHPVVNESLPVSSAVQNSTVSGPQNGDDDGTGGFVRSAESIQGTGWSSNAKKVLLVDNNDETVRPEFLEAAAKSRHFVGAAQFQYPSAFRPDLKLHPHQQAGVEWLQTCIQVAVRKGVLIADDIGVGKTIQILTFLAWCIENGKFSELAKQEPPFRPILIVVPLILLETRTW
jgi:hypothetical protein